MIALTDWELVDQAKAERLDAFEELVRRYQTPAIAFLVRMVGSRQDAEDLAQECFVRVYRHLNHLKPQAKFSTVLFGIARNLALNHIRDGKRHGRDVTFSMTQDNAVERTLEDNSGRPDRSARLHEIEHVLEKALERLTPEHREIILLREMHGLDYDAIARVVKCRKGTVRSRLARAREQLRIHLEELGGLSI